MTFLEESKKQTTQKLDFNQFSFAQSREMLKNVKGSFSEAFYRRTTECVMNANSDKKSTKSLYKNAGVGK